MKRIMSVILGVLILMITAGCILQYRKGEGETSCTKELFAMDTVMSFTAYGSKAEEAVDAAMKEIERLDALLSTGKESSEISQLNAAGSFLVSEDTKMLLKAAETVYGSTDGSFDVTIYPLMQLWGFPTGDYHVPTEAELSEVLPLVNASRIRLEGSRVTLGEGQRIDLGGIAKGYASERVMEIYREYGVTSGMVSLGGNIQTLGAKPDGTAWKIGIRDPETEKEGNSGSGAGGILLALPVENQAVITSGGYERYFEENGETYIHILDPRTGYPADSGLLSVTVVSENGMLADALSTSLYIMGAEKAAEYWRAHGSDSGNAFELILVDTFGKVYATEGLRDKIEMQDTERQVKILER
ncbi:FAD:protein FMN transferase [Anaerosacchariphilus sp. NSJ-68]|uniref:FAD:protein FMN transferase n=2 Tax=Lachnospiraceae TaxID=186803 RepID=A0A923RLL1_9FIRM|nr:MULTISPECIES: FAD:protein FMN transferase [Lachnospiraceae]MBC5659334.1 FAD:protein FMN transferase [Anaerosacchariphilus hominis]MBC5697000.1 FAD:protein FMN transferase [Roseburia difficilis]